MYNSVQKNGFISEYTDSAVSSNMRSMFEATAEHEKEISTDIAEMCSDDVIQCLLSKNLSALTSANNFLVYLRKYQSWCDSENISTTKSAFSITPDQIVNMKTLMVRSPWHLQEVMNAIFEPEKMHTVENLYRAFYWFAYAGIDECDILRIKKSDVDLASNIVSIADSKIHYHNTGSDAIKNAVELNGFNMPRPSKKDIAFQKRVESEYVFSNSSCGQIMAPSFRTYLSKATSGHSEKISYKKVYMSGVFYRVFEVDFGGGDYDKIIKDEAAKLLGCPSPINNSIDTIAPKYRKLKKEYNAWKSTFYG